MLQDIDEGRLPVLVRHALWLSGRGHTDSGGGSGRLALWAEDSALPAAPARRPGRRPRQRRHPFAAGHNDLRTAFDPVVDGHEATSVGIALPTADGTPLPSPELIRDTITPVRSEVALAEWQVPVLCLDADTAYAWLLGPEAGAGPPGGALNHLVRLAEFAADLVCRGRVLPQVERSGPYAVWRPLLTGGDAGWARQLAAAAPPPLASHPQHRAATWTDALDSLVDAAARAQLTGAGLASGFRRGDAASRNWLRALTGPHRRFDAEPAEVAALVEHLANWQADAMVGPVRACFRLDEPTDDLIVGDEFDGEEDWRLHFGLQASDEPSLVVDAEDVWRARGSLPALARPLEAPQETLLSELGKASRLYPELDTALRGRRPAELRLGTEDAHRFLTSTAATLATAGFGVQLPGWWARASSQLSLRANARTPPQPGLVSGAGSVVGFEAIADFSYELAIGGEPLTSDELQELADLKAPLVRFRGRWVELDPRRLAAGLRVVGRRSSTAVGDLLRLALGVGGGITEEELPVTEVVADGWLGDLLSGQAEHRLHPVVPTDGFTGRLRPYQERGLAWLDFLTRSGLGGVLADDMGLGKTVQLLALLAGDRDGDGSDGQNRASLLVCPMSLVGNWQREAARFTPDLRVHVHHGGERVRGAKFTAAVQAADLVVTTYAIAARDAAALREVDWHRVVVDEAQAIKNSATKQAVALRSLPARTRIAVTGTPVENRLADLWSILDFANPGLLGPAATFKKRYAEPIERHGDDEAAERLRQFTTPFILRRVKTDPAIISDLPAKLEMDELCNLTAEQAGLYQAVVDDMLVKIAESEGIERRGLVLATMTKLKQVCNHPAHFLRDGSGLAGRSGKLERLEQVLDEVLAGGERALLFTQYAEFGALLRGHLTGRFGREVLFLHGGVAKADRDEMVRRFQEPDPGAPPLFVLSLKAGGTGLTLTAANHVVHVDRWWNPAVEDQATDRAYRIGQRRSVQVRKFVCAGTVEEKIAAMIAQKRGLAAKIVGSGEQWLTDLSTGQLAELLRLEQGAVNE